MRASGVVFIPEDARSMAAVGSLTVAREHGAGRHAEVRARRRLRDRLGRGARGSRRLARRAWASRFRRRTGRSGTLSGGNVQRVILARELARDPRLDRRVLPHARPRRAQRDARARALLRRRATRGAGVLLISEDLDELFALSDRLVVLFRGRIVGRGAARRRAADASEEVGYLMTGGARRAWLTPRSCAIARLEALGRFARPSGHSRSRVFAAVLLVFGRTRCARTPTSSRARSAARTGSPRRS